ncbi:unnamed protein product [Zymoseptoria tritici ST99CH_1A5]|uniref:Uncharacterized protein n=1 Tax=Zymoseptoria tritici ST99CH_1A5 TaxID=1276529 RepID=A0A1Y6M056_ZYMTR|nr:unnamed protein product [Zymoseptoria tritici ST99CH_1A5]
MMPAMDERGSAITQPRSRPPRQPREERRLLPAPTLAEQCALRPKPLNIQQNKRDSPPLPKAPPPSRNESASYEGPRDPEVVDAAPTWLRRNDSPARGISTRSQTSGGGGRQSEISLIECYLRDPSPAMKSPEMLPPTPELDVAIKKFDFELPDTPSPSMPKEKDSDTISGAERKDSAVASMSPSEAEVAPTQGYSLFPAAQQVPIIQHVRPPARQPAVTTVDPSIFRDITPRSSLPSHPQPGQSYRPRKESLSSSARSRADSINSFRRDRSGQLIPLRILSGGSMGSNARTVSSSTTMMNHSSPSSRWSDDTITSPTVTSMPGPRASFTSLLRQDSAQYPDCFFEDDDESAALSKKFRAWKRSTGGESRRSKGMFDEPESFGRRFARAMMCGCGGR